MTTSSSTTTVDLSVTGDEQQIRELIAERATAMQGRDADRLVVDYLPDTVKFDLAPPLRSTGPALRDPSGLRSWFAGFKEGPMHFEVQDLQVTVGHDVAFCHSLNRLGSTPKGSEQGFELWFRSTIGLTKVDGSWRISHEHTSTPFYMDGSFKAAVDLQP